MKRFVLNTVILLAVVVLIQGCTSSRHEITFDPGTIDGAHFVRKVDQFVVIADGSLSMNDRSRGQRKLGTSEAFVASLNHTIPDLGFEGGLRTFGRGLCGTEDKTVAIVKVTDYIASSFGDGVTRYQCANGTSPLNLAIDATSSDFNSKSLPTAIVIVSDGLDMGKKEIEAAGSLKAAFGDNLDIYAVQIGHSAKGHALLENVVAAGGAGYVKTAADLQSSQAMGEFVEDVFLWPDDDADGVPNHLDRCPDTPSGVEVDAAGCPIDSDGDGVPDYLDKCPNTPAGVSVDDTGCPIDSDGDGVPDNLDKCPDTPREAKVDARGCPLDSDGDGVPDYRDKCPGTPRGVPVNDDGCPVKGIEVAGGEWFVRGKVLFDLNRATIKPEAAEILLKVTNFLRKNPQYMIEIQGNTDSSGPKAWNMELSMKRAEAVKAYLVTNGVTADRLTTRAFGPDEPIAANNTAEGRAKNRRVDFKPSTR